MADHGLTGTHHIDGSQCLGKQDDQGNVLYDCPWSATDYMRRVGRPRLGPGVPFRADDPTTWTDGEVREAKRHAQVNGHLYTCICNRPRGNVGRCDCGKTDEDELLEIQSRRGQRRDIRKPGFERIYGTTVLSCGCGIPWKKGHDKFKDALVCETHGITTIAEFR